LRSGVRVSRRNALLLSTRRPKSRLPAWPPPLPQSIATGKGLSAESLDSVALIPGECLPHDRRFADRARLDTLLSMAPGMAVEDLFRHADARRETRAVADRFDAESGVLTIAEKGRVLLRERTTENEGCRLVGEFFADFLGPAMNGPLRVLEAPGHALADARRKPNATTDKYISLINRASIAALEAAMGVPVDPIRFPAKPLFRSVIGVERARLDRLRNHLRNRPASGGLADHRMCGNAGQSRRCETRPRHRRRPRTRFRPHQYGRL
jgi:hypothetical protein